MKSSTGNYYQSLDHVRGLAAFTVFVWHYYNFNDGHYSGPLIFPLSYFTEGYTGVAVFMTLSGYLFAKLLDGREIRYGAFMWNRFIRLAPLLFIVIVIAIARSLYNGSYSTELLTKIASGVVKPTLPNGGWSITVETHFYVILPLLLLVAKRNRWGILGFLAASLALRTALYMHQGTIQWLSYWTIVGRLDQFVLGIFAYQNRELIVSRKWLVAAVVGGFMAFWYYFDSLGGYMNFPSLPSPSPLWIIIPTFEGLCYSFAIAWYDDWYKGSDGRLAKIIAMIGTYSYSIYLLHFFLVFKMPYWFDQFIFPLSNRYLVLASAIPSFMVMIPIAAVSYHLVEKQFLRFRTRYLK